MATKITNRDAEAPEAEHIRQLEFAISLAQTDLDRCRQGDWLNLQEGLYSFNNSMKGSTRVSKKKFLEAVDLNVIDIQKQFKRHLEEMIEEPPRVPGFDISLNYVKGFSLVWAPTRSEPLRRVVFLEADPGSALYAFQDHLVDSRITLEQIRRCPECERIFLLKHRPQKPKQPGGTPKKYYCSPKCSTKAATRAYRQREAAKVKSKRKGTSVTHGRHKK